MHKLFLFHLIHESERTDLADPAAYREWRLDVVWPGREDEAAPRRAIAGVQVGAYREVYGLSVPDAEVALDRQIHDRLEDLFLRTQLDSPVGVMPRFEARRSTCVGDLVAIYDEQQAVQWWFCAPVGWERVSLQDFSLGSDLDAGYAPPVRAA